MSEKTQTASPGWKLNVKRTFYVGLAFLLISLFWQLYDQTMSIILRNRFGLDQTWSGIVLAIDNFLALFLLPLFGLWSDKTSTKMGKRKPYILIGTIIAAVLLVVISIIDSWQFNALAAGGVGQVEMETYLGKDLYYFLVNGVRGDANIRVAGMQEYANAKELAEEARALYVFNNITKPNWQIFATFMGVLFFLLMAMCSFRTPAVSLMPDVTVKPLRSKANAIINAMGTIGGAIALASAIFLGGQNRVNSDPLHYIPLFALVAGLMVAFLALFFFIVKEVKWAKEMQDDSVKFGIETQEDVAAARPDKEAKMSKEVRRSFILILASVVLWFFAYNASSSKVTSYAIEVLGMDNPSIVVMIGFISALIAFYPVALISHKIGRRKTILIGIVLMTIGFTFAILSGELKIIWFIYIAMAIIGVGWATISVNSYPMVVEMSHGANIGKYTGYYYSASMFAQILTPFISGMLMDALGFRILFYYSAFFGLLAMIPMFFVRHGEPKSMLEAQETIEHQAESHPVE